VVFWVLFVGCFFGFGLWFVGGFCCLVFWVLGLLSVGWEVVGR